MSLVNVRVNTTTFTWRPFLPSLSQNKLLKWAFVKMEQSQLIIQDFKQSSKHTAERNLIWVKQATAHLFLSFMVRERWKERCARVSHVLCLFKWEQKHRRKKKKKCQLAINLPLCSCPNTPDVSSHPSLLPAPHFFLRSPSSVDNTESHVARFTPTFTLTKVCSCVSANVEDRKINRRNRGI